MYICIYIYVDIDIYDFQVIFRAHLVLINIHICGISWSCGMIIFSVPGLPKMQTLE